MATNGHGGGHLGNSSIPADLPSWDEICRGGTIDMAVLASQPAIRYAAAAFGSPLPKKIKGHTRVAANSPIGEQLRSLYCNTIDILQQTAVLQGGTDAPKTFSAAQFDEALQVYKEQQGLPQPPSALELQPPTEQPPADRDALRQKLRSTIASKRTQRTAAQPRR